MLSRLGLGPYLSREVVGSSPISTAKFCPARLRIGGAFHFCYTETMSWSLNRQIIIFLLVSSFFAITGFILWFIYHPRPNCFDGLKNQNEIDVDCGGICLAVCSVEVSEPIIWWQQIFLLDDSKYGVAALIENKNDHFGVERLDYTFKIFGVDQVLLTTVSGYTYLNPNERVVLYEPNVILSGNEPERVLLEFATTTWLRQEMPTPIKLSKSEERFVNSSPNPQARAVIHNDSLETYRDIDIYIVLSDIERNIFAVSQTFIPELGPDEARDVFFNWPAPFFISSSSETIIDIYPRFNTLKQKAF